MMKGVKRPGDERCARLPLPEKKQAKAASGNGRSLQKGGSDLMKAAAEEDLRTKGNLHREEKTGPPNNDGPTADGGSETWRQHLADPPVRNRIRPFWFWNGEMNEAEIARQIRAMAEQGLGGAFVCARQGLKIPYLSETWLDRVDFARRCAQEHGLELWLYDEYPYPSGMAGGEVLLRHPEAEYKYLEHHRLVAEGESEIRLGWSEILCARAFLLREEGPDFTVTLDLREAIGVLQTEEIYQTTGLTAYNRKRFFSYRPEHVLRVKLPPGRWQIDIYSQKRLGEFKYYGAFFDPCCREAVKTFIELTHGAYRRRFGPDFGGTVKGIFSDEVGLLSPLPWSQYLPAYFAARYGEDLRPLLPALHNPAFPGAKRIRYKLFTALHELLLESFHKQVADCCSREGLMMATEVPSMRLTTQRSSHVPGGDCAHEKIGRPLEWIYDQYLCQYRGNAKAVSSLARQLKRDFAMIESFHSLGWSMTLQDAKWMFDRLAASGINFYNVHAFFYSIAGLCKHDAPPSQFLQNPYWPCYRTLADYAARLSLWITETSAAINVAVLDPTASLWLLLGNPFHSFRYCGEEAGEKQQLDEIRTAWTETCKQLLFRQIDYDHLDAELLREGRIENGMLCLGRAAYRLIIVPPTPYIESFAQAKLLEFLAAGGRVLFWGDLPAEFADREGTVDWSSARSCPGLQHLAARDGDALAAAVAEAAPQPFIFRAAWPQRKNLLQSCRRDADYTYLFLANQGGETLPVEILPRDPALKLAAEADLRTGKWLPPSVSFTLAPYESRLLCWGSVGAQAHIPVASTTSAASAASVGAAREAELIEISTQGELPLQLEGRNVFRLENFLLSRDGQTWTAVEPKTFIEQAAEGGVLSADDIRFTGGFGLPKKLQPAYPLQLFYKIRFRAEYLPDEVRLMLDKGALSGPARLSLNGTAVPPETFVEDFVYDKDNRSAAVRHLLQLGENELRVEVSAEKAEDGLRDPFYLLGDFGVALRGKEAVLTAPRTAAPFRLDYVPGCPFYSGVLHYKTSLYLAEQPGPSEQRLTLDVAAKLRDPIELILNGHSLGCLSFAPYGWTAPAGLLKAGANAVEIIRTNTLAPMLDGTFFAEDEHKIKSILSAAAAEAGERGV